MNLLFAVFCLFAVFFLFAVFHCSDMVPIQARCRSFPVFAHSQGSFASLRSSARSAKGDNFGRGPTQFVLGGPPLP